MPESDFTVDNGNEIIDAVMYLIDHQNVPRMDVHLQGTQTKTAKVYWAGTVLRIDIEGLK
jgi:hypothetical protein